MTKSLFKNMELIDDLLHLIKSVIMKCSGCQSDRNVKNGHIHGLQHYKREDYGRYFAKGLRSNAKSGDVKLRALQKHSKGLSFSSVVRILRVSYVTVLKWIHKYNYDIYLIKNDKSIRIMEPDELYIYIRHK